MISKSSEKDVAKLECCDRNLCARCTRCRGPLPLPHKPAGQQARTSLQSASAQRKLEPTLVGQAKHSYVSEESYDALENCFEVHCSIAGQSTSLLDRSLHRRCDLCEHHLLRQKSQEQGNVSDEAIALLIIMRRRYNRVPVVALHFATHSMRTFSTYMSRQE